MEELLLSARRLIQAVGRAISLTKKGYVGLTRDLCSELQVVRHGAESSTAKLASREAKLSELDMKVPR